MSTNNDGSRQKQLQAIVDNEVMLTTIDNPYNPFLQWRDWYAFDVQNGYNTCAYVARLTMSSHELSEADQALAINDAIKQIVSLNLSGKHITVTKENFKDKRQVAHDLSLLK